jgi:hypothetical protein
MLCGVAGTFTRQVDICINFMHIVLISERCVLLLVINWRCQDRNGSDDIINFTRKYRNENKNG